MTQAGLIGRTSDAKGSRLPLRPDEVLFKRANAPVRYEENDYYYAHDTLPAEQQFPDGDLLASLHAYVSSLYLRNKEPGIQNVWRCMDETALIALGILMEETARQELGETGDMAFTEGVSQEEKRGSVTEEVEPALRFVGTEESGSESWSDSGSPSDTAESE